MRNIAKFAITNRTLTHPNKFSILVYRIGAILTYFMKGHLNYLGSLYDSNDNKENGSSELCCFATTHAHKNHCSKSIPTWGSIVAMGK